VAATEQPSDLRPLMATLVSPTNTVIDKDLKKIQAKKNPAWAGFPE